MPAPPEVRWTPTIADHVAQARLEGRRFFVGRMVFYTAVLAGFLVAGLLQVEGTAAAILVGYIAVLWGGIAVALRLRPRIAVRRLRRLGPGRVLTEEHRLVLLPWGALVEADGSRQVLPWELLDPPRASGGYLLLATPPRGGVLVPRAAFGGDEALARFAAAARELCGAEVVEAPQDPVLVHPERWATWSLDLDLGEADYLALGRDVLHRRVRNRWLLGVAGDAMIGCFGLTAALPDGEALFVLGLVVGVLLVLRGTHRWWLALLLPGRVRKMMSRHPARFPLGPAAVWAGPAGLVGQLGASWHRVPWRHVLEVADGPEHLFVYLSPTEAFILPRRNLGSEEAAAAIEAQLRAWTEAAPRGEAASAPLRPAAAAPDPFAPPEEG